ncbi:MAG: sodium:proton antiporter [Bifidobacteriaceae bacterium]|nr:sodium:proton antiporter [Bifidobacteriaceae bacterium]
MESLTLVILVVTGVLVSSILERFIPRVSLPLVQVGLGVIWYFTPFLPTVKLDSELFMVLFISPLLFNAARSTSKPRLMRVLKQSLWLAIGLVFLCIVATGATLHAFWPQISLAAALALGAALAPTDAVAVTQMGRQAQLSERQMEILKGESLFNDAASIVSFEFAVAAAMTGRFSAWAFTREVVVSFVGGIVFGAVLGKLIDWFVTMLRRHRLETTTNRITIEILTPFLIYSLSERLGFSPVLSVVAAGLVIGFHRRGVGSDIARVNLVSNSVWEFLEFTLNGAIFVLLGIQLPIILLDWLHNFQGNIGRIIAAALLLTLVSLTVRFIGVALMLRVTHSEMTGKRRHMTRERWHSALVMTFGGAKGAITISLVFTIPAGIGYADGVGLGTSVRSLLWAIAAIFVLLSLVLTNIMLPALAPRGSQVSAQEMAEANRLLLTTTIERLAQTDTPENHQAVQMVMRSYTYRVARLEGSRASKRRLESEHELRRETMEWEIDWLNDYAATHADMADAAHDMAERIRVSLDVEQHRGLWRVRTLWLRVSWGAKNAVGAVRRRAGRKLPAVATVADATVSQASVQLHNELLQATIDHLFDLVNDPRHDAACVTELMGEYRASLAATRLRGRTPEQREKLATQIAQVRSEAFRIELETIRDLLDEQRITRDQAKTMRRNVHLMEADLGM